MNKLNELQNRLEDVVSNEQSLKNVTFEDLEQELPSDWINLGDMDYVLHGGLQLQYVGSFFDIVEWITPSAGVPWFGLVRGGGSINDIIHVPGQSRLRSDTSLAEVEFTEDALNVLERRFSLRDIHTDDLQELEKLVIDVSQDFARRGEFRIDQEEMIFEPSDYGLDEFPDPFGLTGQEDFVQDMRNSLKDFGLDI